MNRGDVFDQAFRNGKRDGKQRYGFIPKHINEPTDKYCKETGDEYDNNTNLECWNKVKKESDFHLFNNGTNTDRSTTTHRNQIDNTTDYDKALPMNPTAHPPPENCKEENTSHWSTSMENHNIIFKNKKKQKKTYPLRKEKRKI